MLDQKWFFLYDKHMIRVAINGYGRIGRVAHRVIMQKHASEIEIVAINAGSSTDLTGWMYLLKYDTAHGTLEHDLQVAPNTDKTKPDLLGHLLVDGKQIAVYSQKNPGLLPWKELAIDVVIESTGHITGMHHTSKAGLEDHLQAGAKSVVVSAPVSDTEISTYVLSVNGDKYNQEKIISNASCTTNCISPVAKVILENFGITKAMMTTIHSYTSDQRLQDGGHKDYRRARAAANNIIPTSTGATIAAGMVLPELAGIFSGLSIRVPVVVGSLSDFTFLLKQDTTKEKINEVLTKAASMPQFKGILKVTTDPLVSSDIVGSSYSSIVDLSLTQVVGGNLAKVIAWYDNEYGYANRLVEEVVMIGKDLV